MAPHVAEVEHPFDAAALVGPEEGRQVRGRGGRAEDPFPPGGDLRGEGELQAVVVEQREDQVRRERRVVVVARGLAQAALPGGEGGPLLGRDGDDPEAGQNDGLPFLAEERRDLGIGQHPLAGAEDPPQVEPHAIAVRAARAGYCLRHGLDLDRTGALEQVGGLVVELHREEPFPGREDGAEEVGDLDQGLQQVEAGVLLVVEVGLTGVSGEADELGAFGGGGVGVAGGLCLGPERGEAFAAVPLVPDGLEGEPGGLGLEGQHQRTARGARRRARRGGGGGGRDGRGGPRHRAGGTRHRGGPRTRAERGPRIDRQGGNLVRHEFLDLVQPGDGERLGDLRVRRRRAHADTRLVPFDHGVLVALLHPSVDDGVVVSQLQFADLALDVDLPPTLQLIAGECRCPIPLELAEPELQGPRGIDALGTVRLHRSKR